MIILHDYTGVSNEVADECIVSLTPDGAGLQPHTFLSDTELLGEGNW